GGTQVSGAIVGLEMFHSFSRQFRRLHTSAERALRRPIPLSVSTRYHVTPTSMAKRVASSSPHDTSSVALNDQLGQSAQRHLGTLRSALEKRLAALEAGPANPPRGESLPGLILDLPRPATEKAQFAP